MTGGQVIVPIRGTSNQKISITTTYKNLKAGTFEKISSAVRLQKQLVFNDLIMSINGRDIYTSASGVFVGGYIYDNLYYYVFRLEVLSGDGGNISQYDIIISESNTIKYALVVVE